MTYKGIGECRAITLTTGIDNFTGTSGDDTFIGGNGAVNTFGPADQLDGAGGNDTMKLYGGATAVGGVNAIPTIKNIENVYLNGTTGGLNVSGIAGVVSLEADSVATQTYTVTTGQKVGLTNIAAAETLTIAGNTPTALDLVLNKVGTAAATAQVALTGTSVATANVTATGANSNIQLTNAGGKLATLNVAGDKLLKVTSALTTLTTIDASANTGGVNVDAVGASNLTFTGGAGNDRLNLVATLTAADKADGGEGTDTLAISDGTTLTKLTAANVKGFEVLEATGTAAGTLDVDALIANNALTGIVSSATTSATVNNINAEAVNNISVTQSATGGLTFTAKDFVAGGTTDAATINLDNSVTKAAAGIDVGTGLSFVNADVITFNSLGDGTAAKTVASGNGNSVAALSASDLEKVVVTGNETFTLSTAAATAGLTEVDASGLTGKAALSLDTSAAANTSLLVKATANADTIKIDNGDTLLSTIYTGGGSDTVTVNGKATAVNTFKFTTTEFNAGDLKAGDATTITLAATPAAGGKVILDFTNAFENLLKVGGVNLGTTTLANVDVMGALGANTNVAASLAAVGGNDTITVQFDLNGDGVYTAEADAQIAITLTGIATGNSTFAYDGANDYFVMTIV